MTAGENGANGQQQAQPAACSHEGVLACRHGNSTIPLYYRQRLPPAVADAAGRGRAWGL
jgi:hypothetical protein